MIGYHPSTTYTDRHKNCFNYFSKFSIKSPTTKKLQLSSIHSQVPEVKGKKNNRVKFSQCYCTSLQKDLIANHKDLVEDSDSLCYSRQISNIRQFNHKANELGLYDNQLPYIHNIFRESIDYDSELFSADCSLSLRLFRSYRYWFHDIVDYRRKNWKECHSPV